MKTFLLSLVAALVALFGATAFGQNVETPIKSGETLRVSLSGVPANESAMMASIPFTVSDRGSIALPHLATETQVVGMTLSQLGRSLENAYKNAQIYTNPRINITRDAQSISIGTQLVTVGGEVRNPGTVAMRPGLTALDAVTERGGFTEFAKVKETKLIRGGKPTIINLKDSANDVPLQPGDRIIVPQGGF